MGKRTREGKSSTAAAAAPPVGFLLGGGDHAPDHAPDRAPDDAPVEIVAAPGAGRSAAAGRSSSAESDDPPKAADAGAPPAAAYTVLARRYRSRTFDELVGQEPIAQTLKNAIAAGRTAHAYLFCGTRGVGKTSMARIFARALNATDELRQKDEISQAILRGEDLDVIEIDGASYRGINEARELIAGAGLSPARCRYKIYIIDEVHQLTKDAFNALLKTMEEPPAHVKFILCTTEPSRVPATIQSRCQRFDFRAIPTARIGQQLRHILKLEGVTADDEVVAQVARLGHGSMRDALSILDRVLSAGERHLTAERLKDALGMPEQALIARIMDAVVAGDPAAGLKAADSLLAGGTSVEQALESLVDHLRNVMVAATCGAISDLLELSAESREIVGRHAQHLDAPVIVYMIALCESVARNARFSSAARSLFEAAVVRLCVAERLIPIGQLLEGSAAAPPKGGPDGQKKKPGPELTELKPAKPAAVSADPPPPSGPMAHAVGALTGQTQTDGESLWRQVVQAAQGSHADRARVEHLRLVNFDGRTLRLSIMAEGAPMAGWLTTEGPVSLAALVQRTSGRPVRVEIDAGDVAPVVAAPPERLREEAMRLPAVVKAMEVLDAVVIDVRVESPVQPCPDGLDEPVAAAATVAELADV